LRTATKALAEVGAVRNSVSDIEKSIDQLKTSIDQGATREKAVDSRLSALEEKVTSIALQAASPPAAKQKTVEKGKAEKAHKAAEPARAPRIISTAEPKNPVRTIPGDTALETGSIVRSPAIVFGAPVVTRARAAFAIHLASAPSLEALRTSWSLLTEQHGETLARLEARYVAPHAAGGNYRLVAGPLASAAEVDRVCRELQALSVYCASADFAGEPL
jgi:hypothetical protein